MHAFKPQVPPVPGKWISLNHMADLELTIIYHLCHVHLTLAIVIQYVMAHLSLII